MSRARRSQFEVRSYAGRDLYERVLREAAARRISVSECVRTDLSGYYAIQDELSGSVRVLDQSAATSGRRILHTLLAEMETRFVATLDRQTSVLSESLQVLAWMIDRGYLGLMLHLPDVPPGERGARLRRADDRLLAWRDAVRDRTAEGGQLAQGPLHARTSEGDQSLPTRHLDQADDVVVHLRELLSGRTGTAPLGQDPRGR